MAITARHRSKEQHQPALNIHIEPSSPIELGDMLDSLGAIGRRYQSFASETLDLPRGEQSRLYISSIKPGSIDISLIPDLYEAGKAGAAAAVSLGAGDAVSAVYNFADGLKKLLDVFNKKDPPSAGVTIQECNDAINIVKPIAAAGGTQTFNVNNVAGDQILVFQLPSKTANRVMRTATATRENLLFPTVERRKNVALVWKSFERSEARTSGKRSPDKGVIEEIDRKPKSVLFDDDQTALKADIIEDERNLLHMVYYVDVEVVRVGEKITAYRIVGYHGGDLLAEADDTTE